MEIYRDSKRCKYLNCRATAVGIVVEDENFFFRSEIGRKQFLIESILSELDLVREVVKKKKLDTDIDQLKSDVDEILKGIKPF